MPRMLTITGDSIPLPKSLAKKWRGARAELSELGIRVLQPGQKVHQLPEWRKLKPLANRVTQREIAQAIASVRSS